MMFTVAADYLAMIEAKVKFVSFEPLLGQIDYGGTTWQEFMLSGINWVIIGQQTPVRKSTMPKIEWIQDIVQAADQVDVPVFLKDNLYSVLKDEYPFILPSDPAHLRQQWPEVKNDSVIR
jgi:protein gp37